MNNRHACSISLIIALALGAACGDLDETSVAEKGGEDFVLGDVAAGKGDTQLELLSKKDSARIERSLLGLIDALNAQIAVVEASISDAERANAQKIARVREIEAQIASREGELRSQANRNLLLCAFIPNPAICSVAVLIANDDTMRRYKSELAEASAARQRVEQELASYKARKTLLLEQITTIRDTKDVLLAAYKAPGSGVDAYNGESSALNAARYKVDVLRRVYALTQDELLKLTAIKLLAQELSVEIDKTIELLGLLSANVDALIEESDALFMDLLLDIVAPSGRPSTAEKLLDAQITARVKALTAQYDWPISQLLNHLMGITGESDEQLYKRLIEHYATLYFSQTERPSLPIYDGSQTSSSLTIDQRLRPDELSVYVSITHTARGDLLVTLTHEESGVSTLLHANEGANKDNLRKRYTLDTKDIPDIHGTWRLDIADTVERDEGRLVYWTLEAAQKPTL